MMTKKLMPVIPAPEWEVTFKVKFKSDSFPGFGYDPMDIVKMLQKDLEQGRVGHYVTKADWTIDWFKDLKVEDLEDMFRKTNDCPDYLRS